MIRWTMKNGEPTFDASVNGYTVYLDNWAIAEFAEGDASRRGRFLDAVHAGIDLMISVTNIAELSGPQGESALSAKAFLDEVGPHWFPVEMDVVEVIKREVKSPGGMRLCESPRLLLDYLSFQEKRRKESSPVIISFGDDFFSPAGFMDWIGPQRDSIRASLPKMDEVLQRMISTFAERSKRDPGWLDLKLPHSTFESAPIYFLYNNLVRTLIREGGRVKKNDGTDFSHACIASASASFAALDKHWKRRIENIPGPKRIARIYFRPELDQMVADMEGCLQRSAA
jgi:hypothetical protein